ncbi:MAG: ROK family transcriptional regulator [Oscillospiraceae bacterium]|nr:ROK family transcriptional regulator [Oscillospiraceae bacterium]
MKSTSRSLMIPANFERGHNAEETLKANRRIVLRHIMRENVLTRKDLTDLTGLRGATITIIVNELLEKEYIKKVGLQDGGNGRKVACFGINDDALYGIAVQIYYTYVKIGAYDMHFNNLAFERIVMDTQEDVDHTLDVMADMVVRMREKFKDRTLIGVSVGLDDKYPLLNGELVYQRKTASLPISFHDEIAKRTGCNPLVDRTLNISTYDLHQKNLLPSKGTTILLFIYKKSAESGLIINGEIYKGRLGNSGLFGEIYTISLQGERVKFRDLLSGDAILSRMEGLLPDYPDSAMVTKSSVEMEDVCSGYFQDDPLCLKLFGEVAYYLGQLIAIMVNVLDPINIMLSDYLPFDERLMNLILFEAQKGVSLPLSRELLSVQKIGRAQDSPSLLGGIRLMSQEWVANLFDSMT